MNDEVKDLTFKIVNYMEEAKKNNYSKQMVDKDIYKMLNTYYTELSDYIEEEIRAEYEEIFER